jgi:hypothetical protein
MSLDKKQINGNAYSWGSIVAKVKGQEFNGLIGVMYSQKRERVKVYGTGRHQKPRGRTRGKYSAEAKLTVVRGTMADFVNFLAAQAPDGVSYGDVVFQTTIQYVEDDETPMLVELVDCVIGDESATDDEGAEALKDEVAVDVMRIRKNGKTLYDSSKG